MRYNKFRSWPQTTNPTLPLSFALAPPFYPWNRPAITHHTHQTCPTSTTSSTSRKFHMSPWPCCMHYHFVYITNSYYDNRSLVPDQPTTCYSSRFMWRPSSPKTRCISKSVGASLCCITYLRSPGHLSYVHHLTGCTSFWLWPSPVLAHRCMFITTSTLASLTMSPLYVHYHLLRHWLLCLVSQSWPTSAPWYIDNKVFLIME